MTLRHYRISGRVRKLPIRIKLSLLSVLVVLSLSSILYLSWYRDASLREMNETRTALMSMDKMLLSLERSENNFVNLFDNRHRDEFSETFEKFVSSTENLKIRFWSLGLPIATLERLVELTSEYRYLFEIMAEQLTKIGQNGKEGLRGELTDALAKTEASLQHIPTDENTRIALHRRVIILQLFTKDLLLHKDTTHVERFQSNFDTLMMDVANAVPESPERTDLVGNLHNYQAIFLNLAETVQQIGLDFDHGLRGKIAWTVAQSHQSIRSMTAQVNAAIERQEVHLNIIIGTLAGLFSLLFLIALMFLGRSISTPIREVTDIMTRLADGNLTVQIPDQPRRDEIGDMLRALRVFKMGAIIRRRTQEELRTAHNELENRVEERTRELSEEIQERKRAESALLAAREQAESANKAKSMFIANMSHELRTPLNAIIGYSEMLKEDTVDLGYSSISDDLDKIHSAGRHLLGIINEILDLSKIEAGRIDLSIDYFAVQDVVDTVCGTVRPLIAANNNTFEIICNPDVGDMQTDLTRLRQILFNFLSNAAKFTTDGKITLSAVREPDIEGDSLVFTVSDTGIGMSKDQLDVVFEPFTQADTSTTRKYGGTGLGLTVNREFARLMGGEVMVKSAPDEGSTFTVRLPAVLNANDVEHDHEHPDTQNGIKS